MINLKHLLLENFDGITPSDIANFYFLFTVASYQPQLLQTNYGKFIQDEYLKALRNKYISIFKLLIYEQIKKYVLRNRIDPDFPKEKLTPSLSARELLELMKKTFRSDMKLRNDVWILTADFLHKLETSKTTREIYLYIDRLNNMVHNTGGNILGKFSTGQSLIGTYEKIHKAKSTREYENFVDKDLRQLKSQETIQENSISMSPEDLAKLTSPPSSPGSASTPQAPSVKPKDIDKKVNKDVPAALKISPLQETDDDIDAILYGKKKIPADRPPDIHTDRIFKTPKKDDKKNVPATLKIGPLQEALDAGQISKEDRENMAFMTGLKIAVQDKTNGVKRDLSGYPEDFVRGYMVVKRPGWWDKFNTKLTQWAADLGRSYGNR